MIAPKQLLDENIPFVLGGDYNVAPDDGDVYDIERMKDDAICQEEGTVLYRKMLFMGLTNAFKMYHPQSGPVFMVGLPRGGWNKDHMGFD